ncbi:hypothetical protein PsorP6_005210 [Peronosclerospora sorghi]|uniref:Uncharacterized protein n=1 Tax=Peronosclerospora sorghi TaxID=230839 RepID=A0ACC0W0V8_9STRA|nr:hypothetical protein PsorP6_005210 [Peronosclerospora sorghi]
MMVEVHMLRLDIYSHGLLPLYMNTQLGGQNISTVATTRNLRMSSTSDFPSLLLAAVNKERAAHGLPPLV